MLPLGASFLLPTIYSDNTQYHTQYHTLALYGTNTKYTIRRDTIITIKYHIIQSIQQTIYK